MDRTKLIGIGIVAAALLALLLLKALKRKDGIRETAFRGAAEKKGGSAERTAEESLRQPLINRDSGCRSQEYADRRLQGAGRPGQAYAAEEPPARTVLLTYNTLILTDVERPARSWRADLFQPVCIGRSRECGICIREESVSRKHLRVFRDGAHVYAENLNSLNGTLLNGKILKGPKEIFTGSRLKLGRVELSVEID